MDRRGFLKACFGGVAASVAVSFARKGPDDDFEYAGPVAQMRRKCAEAGIEADPFARQKDIEFVEGMARTMRDISWMTTKTTLDASGCAGDCGLV